MSIQIEQAARYARLGSDEIASLRALAEAYGRVTLVVPGFGMADACCRALADAGCGLGVQVTTQDGWVQELWDLLGDGRRLVTWSERRLIMAQVLADYLSERDQDGDVSASESRRLQNTGAERDASLTNTSGMIDMLAGAAQAYLPFIAHRAPGVSLTAAESQLAVVLGRYAARLDSLGRIEAASAASLLIENVRRVAPASARAVVVRGLTDMPEHLLGLLEAVAEQGTVHLALDSEVKTAAARLLERFSCAVAPDAAAPDGWDSPVAVRADGVAAGGPTCEEEALAVAPALNFAEVCGPAARDASYTELIAGAARLTGAADMDISAATDEVVAADAVAVATTDPLASFRALAPRLAARGIGSTVATRVSFCDTRAGQMVMSLVDLLERVDGEEASAWWPAPEIPDWICSPFSGMGGGGRFAAWKFDKLFRKRRQLDKERLLRELRRKQDSERNFERKLAEDEGREPRPIEVFSVIEALDAARYREALELMRGCAAAAPSFAFGSEGLAAKQAELGALQVACNFLDEARRLGVGARQAFLALSGLTVRYALELPADDAANKVVFCSTVELAERRPGDACAVLLLDADATSYPLSERETPVDLLAAKLGCRGVSAKPAECQRVAFRRAVAAGKRAVLAYVARDRQAEKRYAALAYTEAKAAERERLVGEEGLPVDDEAIQVRIDRLTSWLPNEGALFANLDVAGGAGAACDARTVAAEHVLPAALHRFLLLPTKSVGGRVVPRALSASQIEAYLSCPYQWLVSNRAPSQALDVEFGPIEMGNFVHDVMQRFHERLIEVGLMRVRPETLDACMEQMDIAFEEMRADHASGKLTHGKYANDKKSRAIRGPLVPLDELERNRLDAMLPKLHEVVRYESDMLGIFMPTRFEYSFNSAGVSYAGHPLGGRIDRIDTAPDAGRGERVVVIDYKNRTSVKDLACPDPSMMLEEGEDLTEGWLPGRDADRAPKVQTLIYARALEYAEGVSAQGAVYFATRGPQVAGAVSDALAMSEPPAFPRDAVSGYPGVKPPRSRTAKHDGYVSFDKLLGMVEDGVAAELEALEHGAIAPRPASDSCTFCPLAMCEKRR